MTQLKDEGKDLWLRFKKLFKTLALSVILFLQVSLQIVILLLTVWTTFFIKGKEIADRKTHKISYGTLMPTTLFPGEN